MKGKIRFAPGSLVFAKYSTYPIWPGTVQKNTTPGYNRWVDFHPNRAGEEVLSYWIIFSGDKEGGWVSSDNLVRFHPSFTFLVQVSEKDSWYADQARALHIIHSEYKARNPRSGSIRSASKEDMQRLHTLRRRYETDDIETDIVGMHMHDYTIDYTPAAEKSIDKPKNDDFDPEEEYDAEEDAPQQNPKSSSDEESGTSMPQPESPVRCSNVKLEATLTDALTYHPPVSVPSPQPLQPSPRRLQPRRRVAKPAATAKFLRPIPSTEQWHRATDPLLFRRAAGRLEKKYSDFCRGVQRYARVLEELQIARTNLSELHQDLRREAQTTEYDMEDADHTLSTFLDVLRERSTADEDVDMCE